MDETVTNDGTDDDKEEEEEVPKVEERVEEEHSGMDGDEESGQEMLENNQDLDQDKKEQGSEGLNEDKSNQSISEN